MTILQCSLTNIKEDLFYKQLQAEVEIIPQHDILADIGDLNSKVGSANTGNVRVIKKNG